MKKKSIAGAVLGIVGAAFAIIGGLGLALCAEVLAELGYDKYVWVAYVFGLGSGVVGLVGAILDFSKCIIGGILQAVAVAMILVVCIVMYFSWAMIVALILLGVGTILSFLVKKSVE